MVQERLSPKYDQISDIGNFSSLLIGRAPKAYFQMQPSISHFQIKYFITHMLWGGCCATWKHFVNNQTKQSRWQRPPWRRESYSSHKDKRYFASHGFQISLSSSFLSKAFKTTSIAESEEIESIRYWQLEGLLKPKVVVMPIQPRASDGVKNRETNRYKELSTISQSINGHILKKYFIIKENGIGHVLHMVYLSQCQPYKCNPLSLSRKINFRTSLTKPMLHPQPNFLQPEVQDYSNHWQMRLILVLAPLKKKKKMIPLK